MDFHHRDQNTSEILYLTVKEGTADGWTVNLDQGGQRLANNIKLQDPLNTGQREAVRWYLEDFLAISPFLIDKAVAAEELLLEYPKKLVKSLGLDTIILSRLRWNKLGTDSQVLQLVICQDIEKCYGDSIHRLFWETLESPSLWNSRLQVVVQRSLADTVQQSPSQDEREDIKDHDVSLPTIEPIGKFNSTKPFNVLLVVARDLRRNQPSMRQDVAPGLALEVLLGIKKLQQEQQHKSYMRLNVEVVRPGTLAAFEHHLQQREEEHGPNYFDAVHFDMHGKIGTRKGKGTKTAILYFSSSRLIPIATGQRDEKDTEAVPALMVARIVKRYHIPLVILNACHSAAADSGANANMAHHFLKRGVQNVVGMSFKVSHAAATIFLYDFYYALLIDGLPIPMSAAIARMGARVKIKRRARYGLQRDLRDGFVPVLYGAPGTARFCNPRNPRNSTEQVYFDKLKELDRRGGPSFCSRPWYGRDFDLLRLERLLCQSSIIYLHGLAGVGKSFLIDSAIQLWKDTNYIDIAITVDFGYRAEVTYKDLIMAIICQIQLQKYDSERIKLAVGTASLPKTEHSVDDDTEKTVLDIVKRLHCTIIIEGFEIFPISPFPQIIAGSNAGQILSFLRQLIQSVADSRRDRRLKIIFSHRRADPSLAEGLLGYNFGPYRYALLPLDLPDAMDFATEQDGEDTTSWKSDDIDHLESTLTLLQCIPGALSAVLEVRHRKPWPEFYQHLHRGLFSSTENLELDLIDKMDALQDFQDLSITPPYQFFMFCLLGLFWTVAPPIHYLLPIFDAIAPPPIKQALDQHRQENMAFTVQAFQQVIVDRGYVTYSADEMTLHIHPMYTIVAQTELQQHLTIGNRVTMAAKFGAALEIYVSRPAMAIIDDLWIPNYLKVMESCVKEVPVDVWPLSFMGTCCIKATQHLPRATKSTLYSMHVDLLHALTFKLRLLDDKISHLAFFAFSILHLSLVSVTFDDIKHHRLLDLAEQGTNKLMIWDSLQNNDAATLISIYKGFCLVTWAFTLLFTDEFGAFSERVEDLRCLTTSFNVSDEEVHNYTRKSQNTVKDSEEIDTQTHTIRDLQIWVKYILYVFDALEIQIQRGDQATCARPSPPTVAASPVSIPFRPARTERRARKAQQLQASLDSILPHQQGQPMDAADWQWTMYRLQMSLLLDITGDSFDYLAESSNHVRHTERINSVQEDEDWFSVCTEQMKLVFDLLSREQLRGANAHLQAIQAILNKADVPEELIRSATRCHERISDAWYTLMCRKTLFPESLAEVVQGIVSSSVSSNADTASLTEWMLYLIHHHIQEAIMMQQATAKIIENKFIDALGLLCQLGDRFDVILGRYPQAKEYIRSLQRTVLLLAKYHSIIQEVYRLALQDVDAAKRSIPGQVALLGGLSGSHLQAVTNELHLIVVKHEFVCCRINVNIMQQAASSRTPIQRELFRSVLRNFQNGNFQALHSLEVVVDTRVSVVRWLMDDAVKMKQWTKALAYCADYKAHAPLSLQQDTNAKAIIFHVEEECRWNLVLASLDEAEATLRFARCIKMVEYMSKLKRWASSLPGIPRWAFWLYPDRMLSALKQAYKQPCLVCARWLRNQGNSAQLSGKTSIKTRYGTFAQALLRNMQRRRISLLYTAAKKKRGLRIGARANRHNCHTVREKFRRPAFGCAHHCRGDYCFH